MNLVVSSKGNTISPKHCTNIAYKIKNGKLSTLLPLVKMDLAWL